MSIKENQKESRDFLDRNILSLDVALKNQELIKLVAWAETAIPGGGPLHIILEDGNYSDGNVEFCKNELKKESGVGYKNIDRIIQLLEPLTKEQREMLCNGTTITGSLFDLLYNQCLQE